MNDNAPQVQTTIAKRGEPEQALLRWAVDYVERGQVCQWHDPLGTCGDITDVEKKLAVAFALLARDAAGAKALARRAILLEGRIEAMDQQLATMRDRVRALGGEP